MRRGGRGFSLGGLVIAAGMLALAPSALAGTYVPTRTDDPHPGTCTATDCSLREAVKAANAHPGSDTIKLRRATYNLTRPGAFENQNRKGDLDVTAGSLTIRHSGSGVATIDANQIDRALDQRSGTGRLTLTKLIIRNGGGDPGDGGGAVSANGSKLEISRSSIRNSALDGLGGGVYAGAATHAVISRTSFTGNNSSGDGGGLYTAGPNTSLTRLTFKNNSTNGDGGGFADEASAPTSDDLVLSYFDGNHAAGHGGGIRALHTTSLTVTASAFHANTADDSGGAIAAGQGSIVYPERSTFYRNSAKQFGGAIDNAGGSTVGLYLDTIVGNQADSDGPTDTTGDGGGIQNYDADTGTQTLVTDSIVAVNYDGGGAGFHNCSGTITDNGHNLFQSNEGANPETHCGGPATGDIFKTNGESNGLQYNGEDVVFANNGGPTPTIALIAGAPEIDTADPSSCVSFDQRGVPRNDSHVGSSCDIGAYERATCRGVLVNQIGTSGNDTITGSSKADGFLGFGGKDALFGAAGNDALCGGSGNDHLDGGPGNDKADGGPGNDTCIAEHKFSC